MRTLVLALALLFTATGAHAQAPDRNFFLIGTFVQPPDSFASWKERGINTLVAIPQGQELEPWNAAAVANDLWMIRVPRPDPMQDLTEPKLFAWEHDDEPSNVKPGSDGVRVETVNITPAQIDEKADGWRAALPAGPGVPTYLNLTGAHVNDRWINAEIMADYVDGPSVDYVAHDYYTVNSEQPMLYELETPDGYPTTRQGRAIDRLLEWSGGKRQFAFIETNDYDRNGTGPDRDQFRAEIWSSIIHGASGIIYFPVAFNPWSWDATPAALNYEMAIQHARIHELEPTLLDPATGQPRGTLLRMVPQGVQPGADQLPYPFEGRVYDTPDGQMYVVLNLDPNGSATLSSERLGVSDLQFGRYEVKVGMVKAR